MQAQLSSTMASTNCLRCLARPSLSPTNILNSCFLNGSTSRSKIAAAAATSTLNPISTKGAAQFSTTSVQSRSPINRPATTSGRKNEKVKGQKTLRIKKKPPPKTGKPPAPGERKAMRKRVVLSNTNALEVQGLRELDAALVGEWEKGIVREGEEDAEDENWVLEGAMGMVEQDRGEGEGEEETNGEEVIGQVVGLMGSTVDSLRAVEAFKTAQGWGLFRRPGLLVREESVAVSRKLIMSEEGEMLRLVIDGERGTGKSVLLLHAMATAFVRGWIVLNIPEAQEVTNAMNDYSPLPGTTPTLFSQPTYTANWLSQINKANTTLLQDMELSLTHNLPIPIQSNISLSRLCELGARDPDVAWPIFQAFWAELMAEGRPPVLLALDGLNNVMRESMYRAPDVSFVHAHDLAIVNHFVGYLSGERKLGNGGAVIAATNRSHAPKSKSLDLVLTQLQERQLGGEEITEKDPFEKGYDGRVDWALGVKDVEDVEEAAGEETVEKELSPGPVEVLKLKGLSKKEARGLMEYWAKSGVLRKRVDEEEVAEKWALAGNGVVGEIERGALKMRI